MRRNIFRMLQHDVTNETQHYRIISPTDYTNHGKVSFNITGISNKLVFFQATCSLQINMFYVEADKSRCRIACIDIVTYSQHVK